MLLGQMHWDQIMKFARTITGTGDVLSIQTTAGSSSGDNFSSSKRSDTMRGFDRTISNDRIRVV